MLSSIADLAGDWELVFVVGFAVTAITFLVLRRVYRTHLSDMKPWEQDDRDLPHERPRQR